MLFILAIFYFYTSYSQVIHMPTVVISASGLRLGTGGFPPQEKRTIRVKKNFHSKPEFFLTLDLPHGLGTPGTRRGNVQC